MKNKWVALRLVLLACGAGVGVGVLLMASCRGRDSGPVMSWSMLAERLIDPSGLARIDGLSTEILTSYDPSGSNEDYNHYVRKDSDGWIVLADVNGPGYISRFWFTGAETNQRIRCYFDGESKPRLDLTLDQFAGGQEPFTPPLAAYENYCWYNYTPIPYAKRLIIKTQAGGFKKDNWPRLFYQVNVNPLPSTSRVASFSLPLSAGDAETLNRVRTVWNQRQFFSNAVAAGTRSQSVELVIAPGQKSPPVSLAGPAFIRRLQITPDWNSVQKGATPARVLRDVVLRIRWNGSSDSSVEVPMGDFFGSAWQTMRYESLFFGMTGDHFVSHFPMPFAQAADIQLENQGVVPVSLSVKVHYDPIPAWDARYGYFHAAWRKTLPRDVGQPHEVLSTQGRGRYAGCLLSVYSMDRSYWLLEGDESMVRDGETSPFWHGTGLEDYFNGGWYYQDPLIRPLHGLAFKTFFGTVQYRVHLADPVLFNKAFRMQFERGPEQASKGLMESVAFYYLATPAMSGAIMGTADERQRQADDEVAKVTIVSDLLNLERLNDYRSAFDKIESFIRQYPDYPFIPQLRLRQVAYIEKEQGFDKAKPLYVDLLQRETNAAVHAQARQLMGYHESKDRALASVWCTAPSRLFLDGVPILEAAGQSEKIWIAPLEIKPGKHVLAVQSRYFPYPGWVQVCLRTHRGDVMSTPAWRHAVNPAGTWMQATFDDSAWKPMGGTGMKGPPEEPFVWIEPNAFVDMQSKPAGMRPVVDWESKSGYVVFRWAFELKD